MTSLRINIIGIFYKAAKSSRKTRILLTPLGLIFGLIVFSAVILLFIFLALQLDRFLQLPKPLAPPLNIIVALFILAGGLFLILWSVLRFIRAKGTPVPFNPPPKLVNTGLYAYIRNPMLTGWFILLFGLGVLLRSISLVCLFTPLFIMLSVLELKAIEEPELERRFGQPYREYKKRVPMFLPWCGGKPRR